jgi:mannose-6-phosphate isomerase-like protein (cupin superfamily)
MREAQIDDTDTGRVPADDGWFILNLEEIQWIAVPGGGTWCMFESPDARSPLLGIGVHVLNPGEAPGMYHAESNQEGFLVLSGECLAIVEGQERRMRAWDYLHCPPGTAHITIGAGDGPCAILMVGTRDPGKQIDYIPEPAAQRYGVAVQNHTHDPKVAYAARPPWTRVSSPWPLPGASTA